MKEIRTCPICQGHDFTPIAETKDFTITQQTFSVIQCLNCSLGITSPQPPESELDQYYQSDDYISHTERNVSIFDSLYRQARNYTLRWKHELIRTTSPANTLLDFGCGTGEFLEFMQHRGYIVKGVEPSEKARTLAIRKLSIHNIYPSLEEVNSQFANITLWHVLEHIPDLNQTIEHLKSLLTPDGTIFIAVPNLNSWDSKHYKNFWAAYDTPRHLWHFTQQSIPTLLKKHRLRLIGTKPMKLDAFYVSLLSEKYLNSRKHSIGGTINAIANGARSNLSAQKTGEYSSLIYIVRNEHQ